MNKAIAGAITEHWMDKRMRLGYPINLEGNVPRMSALTLLKLHDIKNKMLGTNKSLYEASELAKEKALEYKNENPL